jgi:hypothetical protein
MWIVAVAKLTILYFAIAGSIRAPFAMGIVVALVLIYMPIALLLAAIPPHVELPLATTLSTHRWVYFLADAGLGALAMVVAFRRARRARDNLDLRPHLERAGYAYLGNTLLGAAALLLLALFAFLTSRQ